MNKHTELNLSFDLSGMPAGVVGARSWAGACSYGIDGQGSDRLTVSRPRMV
jgi:hypothetical protein